MRSDAENPPRIGSSSERPNRSTKKYAQPANTKPNSTAQAVEILRPRQPRPTSCRSASAFEAANSVHAVSAQ